MSAAALPPPASRQRFRRALLSWYRKNGRNLPWRHTDDPYHILVSDTWRPLGYNIRPRRLHAIARESVARFGGELPSDEATLLSFKGIGAYTAGAIRSFAFGQRAAILDTNVARVLFRVFVGRGDAKAHSMRRHLWSISAVVLPYKQVFDFNQALMDLGATVCVARKPRCMVCPIARMCRSYPARSRR